ncbi:MAG: energy-coupled thiamine transporter ThiT [Ruminococcus sp.]|nr:energy-coupled thiamine transporter ThiT [Ruminococcus sp.]
MKINFVRRLTESAIMLAASTVLSMIPLIDMPFGGKLTPLSMLPVLLIAYRYGCGWGFVTSFTYGLIQMVLGLDNLTYATNWVAVIAIILLDYLVAYGVLGFGGVFRGKLKHQWLEFSLGVGIGCVLRFLCHFITGITVWADTESAFSAVALFSLGYNGCYMLPEMVLTVIVGVVLTRFFDLTSPDLKRVKKG